MSVGFCLIEGRIDGSCEIWQNGNELLGEEEGGGDVAAALREPIDDNFELYDGIIGIGGSGKPSEEEAAGFGEISDQVPMEEWSASPLVSDWYVGSTYCGC